MLERFYLKDYLSFLEVELHLQKGLIVFSGPSGSGKSILLNAVLSSLGLASCEAKVCESSLTWKLDSQNIGIENEELNVFKQLKKEKVRYFINAQGVSKKTIANVASQHLKHLSLKDFSDFENKNLLALLDDRLSAKNISFFETKEQYKKLYKDFLECKSELEKLYDAQKRIVELKEFAAFEIQKIDAINPRCDEDEELMVIKKELSKKEKVMQNIAQASKIFEFEHYVNTTLDYLEEDSSFFDDAMNELRAKFDNAQEHFSALDDIDVEEVLTRIEQLSVLKRRYGSIEEALEYREKKRVELQNYENIEITKDDLEKKYNYLEQQLEELAQSLHQQREQEIILLERELNGYLQDLYLQDATLHLSQSELHPLGKDEVNIALKQTELSKISTGEFNRLRLALLALKSEYMKENDSVLMLDEIDANLSGEESMSVAKVLQKLSKHFQIFVISHQPQLTSMGDQHFFIYKEDGVSKVKELTFSERIEEIARIISGETISNEARSFARELLEAKRNI